MTVSRGKSIIMVCSQMPPVYGGAGTQAALLGATLAKRDWDVIAVTLDQSGVGSRTENGVKFVRLLRGVESNGPVSRAATTLGLSLGALIVIILRRPRIVHIHGAYWWSILPAIAGRVVKAKVVTKLTRDGEDDAHSVFSKKVGNFGVGRVYGLSLSLAHAVVVLNERARTIANTEGIGPKVSLMLNGVDSARMARTEMRRSSARARNNLSDDDRVVIFVGYLVKHKGVVDLLSAWRHLQDRSSQLWLVGPIEGFYRELEDAIPQLIKELQDDGFNIRVLGHVPSADLPNLYWSADVFTLPSYAEGMPNSLAEAMVAGCDVVATTIPGTIDLVGSDFPKLVRPGDVESLAGQLAKAIKAPEAVPLNITERLRIEKVAEAYEQLYSHLGVVIPL